MRYIDIMLRHRLKVLQNNDSSGRSVLCKTAEQLLEFLLNMDNEIWLPVVGYEWLYEISNLGNVKSLIFRNKQTVKNRIKILKLVKQNKWYYKVMLSWEIKKRYFIHRLVAQAFMPNPENKRTVNHINGKRDDNRVENLEWATDSENIIHSYKYLWRQNQYKWMKPYNNPLSIKVVQISLSWEFIKEWDCMNDIQRELNISQWNISACCRWIRKKASWYIWKYKDKKQNKSNVIW